jgi:cytosine/adenosine deaminase-related metal-dependent hydrolase
MPEAMRLASLASRAFDGGRDTWLSAVETLRLATEGGAGILGLAGGGRIAVGALADLTFYDLRHIDFMPLNDPLNQVVTAAGSDAISDVMVGGRFVKADGRISTIDPSTLRERVVETVARLTTALAGPRALAARLEPHVVAFAERERAFPLPISRLLPVEGERTS